MTDTRYETESNTRVWIRTKRMNSVFVRKTKIIEIVKIKCPIHGIGNDKALTRVQFFLEQSGISMNISAELARIP